MDTRIFLDSGDVAETKAAITLLGSLDGQTTNPSLIAKNPHTQGKKFTKEEIYAFYRTVVQEISSLIPNGSVSVEVYSDKTTSSEAMLVQAKEMNAWIPNAHIKLPITKNGLTAAAALVKQGIKVNLTLCFSQQQAAAVYAATIGAKKGDVFLSPFIGRLDDKGINGMDLINNCLEMFKGSDGHVELVAASIRNLDHLLNSINLKTDVVTVPLSILKEWQANPTIQPASSSNLKPITYEDIDLSLPWEKYNLQHELTDTGIDKFCADWNQLIKI